MPKFYSFPHYEINVKDESMRSPLIVEQLALHRPIYFSFAEKGEPGVPHYGSYDELSKIVGDGTFDLFSKYYKHPSLFLQKALQTNKVFLVRLADDTCKSASLVLECSVHQQDLVQYQKDGTGFRLKDANGDPIPIDDGAGGSLMEPGTVVKWSTRPLADGEDPKAIAQSTSVMPDPYGGSPINVTTYPVAVMITSSPGAYGNNSGFKMYWDAESDNGVAASMDSLIFKIAAVDTKWGSDTPSVVRNKYLETSSEFTFREGTTDKATMRRYNLNEVLENDWDSADLPWDIVTYPANVEAISAAALASESVSVFPELTSAWMVNLMTGKSLIGQDYDHISVDFSASDAVLLDENVIHFSLGGADGDLSDATLESLTREWLTGNVFPEIMDQLHYPITHLYDSGYESATKEAMIDFLGIRDDVKLIMSTQSVYEQPNTKSEDQSMGSFLRSRALLHPESFIYGTQACRVTILQQCGTLNEVTPYTGIVPATLDCMLKKCEWQGAIYMKGKPKGLPKSAVTCIKDINWFPVQPDFKQLSWDNALNYMQYYDMTSVHYPDVISVYPYQTSLLSDDIFTDMIVYLKHVVHFQWAKFAGVDDPINQLIGDIRDSVGRDIYAKFGNFMRAEVNPYQTDTDEQLGYALTVEIAVYGTVPNRVWNVIVPVRRELVA